ncbi:lysoplasmalogenase family protein [Isoptericola cucumis]|uniref:Lysoplasmalogenase n=1 Tax=Isoptericola cucumis TaxID=1776856 RepID=A0ABQ2BDN3_9MICO|nr:lysoplasmalogenase family protein [Isoptericola cucumis]GGI11397.1 hypothetical protein GCM10007368_36000 [Isoptericola cucumis]
MTDDARPAAAPAGAVPPGAGPPDVVDVGAPRGVLDRFRWWRRKVLPTAGAQVAAALFVVVLLVDLAARLLPGPLVLAPAGSVVVVPTFPVAQVAQSLLMPLLALTLLAATSAPRSRTVRLVLLALVLSALGDLLPGLVDPRWSWVATAVSFAGAQVTYVVAFWPYRRDAVAGRRRLLPAVYGVAYVLVVGAVAAVVLPAVPGAGGVATVLSVAGYGLPLVATAVLAAGVGRASAAGAALLVVSYGLLGLSAAGVPWAAGLPAGSYDLLVVAPYAVGQALIVLGVIRRG